MATGSSSWISKTRRTALYIRDSFTCVYCGKSLKDCKPAEMGLDHLEDLVVGGGHKGANHASTNLVLCCRSCNSSRGNTDLATFAARFPGAAERIEVQRNAFVNLDLAKSILNGKEE